MEEGFKMVVDLHYETTKFIVQRLKTNLDNIVFNKLLVGQHSSFNDNFWEYWLYDSWEEMDSIWYDYYSSTFPPEEDGCWYFNEEYM